MAKQNEGVAGNENQSSGEKPAQDPRPLLTIGRTVHVTDRDTGSIHAAMVTHVNENQSAVCTVFKPHETIVGVGFAPAPGNLAAAGHWHWPSKA